MITKDWKVSKVLEEYPQTLEVFVAATPHFKKLRNPLLRKVLAARVTVQQAANIGGVEVEELLRKLNAFIGVEYVPQNSAPADRPGEHAEEFEHVNRAIVETIAREEVVLDVRPIISSGFDPLKVILQTVRGLKQGQALHLINSFEPIPLYSVLGDRGFEHFTRNVQGVWHVWFFRRNSGSTEKQAEDVQTRRVNETPETEERIIELDVRGLAPPEPMMRILERLGAGRWWYALPTEAEWEKAARGPDSFDYGLGMTISDAEVTLYNWKKNPDAPVTVVGWKATLTAYESNRFGLYHMSGNVAEWSQGVLVPYNRNRPYRDDERNHDETPGLRVVRGGSWYSAATSYLYIPYRDAFQPEHSSQEMGFRVVVRRLP